MNKELHRLRSRFNYQRKGEEKEMKSFYASMKIMEPEAIPDSTNFKDWTNKTFEACIMTKDPECVYGIGSIRDSSLAYFCGQDEKCLEYGTTFAIRKAKENIEAFYPVVVVLERMQESLIVAESLLPTFFNGSQEFFARHGDLRKNQGPKMEKNISIEARNILLESLHPEYELYDFLQQRLAFQLEKYKLL